MLPNAETNTDYTDEDLTFFLLTHRDYDAAVECLRDLRKHYPVSRVIMRSDGDGDPRLASLALDHQVEFYSESHLFGIEHGGAVIERMFALFFQKPSRYLLKIDPDTVIHRRFEYLPIRDGVFGTLQTKSETPSVQGGCMAFTQVAAEQIFQSALLRNSRLKNPAAFIDESPYFFRMAHRADRCGLASFDWIVSWIANQLDISLFEFEEVNSGWKMAPPNPDGRYAVTHPR